MASTSNNGSSSSTFITEGGFKVTKGGILLIPDEASLYDRQIRLWGLEAQNKMRSSTVLILSLKGVAHETIKNLVLAGIGRLIVMDDGVVTEEDLGSGFLFREEEGAVGTNVGHSSQGPLICGADFQRTAAALPQIASLNPLVNLTAIPTLAPFIRGDDAAAQVDTQTGIVEFLQREKVDVVVASDMSVSQLVRIKGVKPTDRVGVD